MKTILLLLSTDRFSIPLIRYLVLEGLLSESAVELLSSPKLWQHLPKILSPEMVDRLLQAPTKDDRYPLRDRALLAVLYATGCRASETTAMRIRDVNLKEGFCRCTGKGDKERLVSLNPTARKSVEAYLERRSEFRPESKALFLSRRGRRLTTRWVQRLVQEYGTALGDGRRVTPHSLRHSCATAMLERGADLFAIRDLLGHASIATTQRYTHLSVDHLLRVHANAHPLGRAGRRPPKGDG